MNGRSDKSQEASPYGGGWDYTGETPNAAPEPSQTLPEQGRGLYSRWEADGVVRHELPASVAQVSMRGGHSVAQPSRGDDVELYVDIGKGKGEWRPGYVALTGMATGEMGGAYDGEDVIVVCKSADYNPTDQKHNGAEWPAEFARLVQGSKPSTRAEAEKPEGLVDKTKPAKFTVATFFRPDQLRGYHGRWVNENRQKLQQAHYPEGQRLEDAVVGETEKELAKAKVNLARIMETDKPGVSPEVAQARAIAKVKKNALDTYDLVRKEQIRDLRKGLNYATPQNRNIDQTWYYEVHDMAWEWAKKYDIRPEIVAGVIATLSPQVKWGEPGDSPKQFLNANQGYAWKVLRMVFEHGDDEITITSEMALQGQERSRVAEKKDKVTGAITVPSHIPENELIDYENYHGLDNGSPFVGKSLIGRKMKLRDLPADVLWQQFPKDLKGMMKARGTAAIRLARGEHPNALAPQKGDPNATLLNGPKIRSFYNNIVNPQVSTESTMDVHMIHLLTRIDLTETEANQLVQTPGAYLLLSDIVASAAKERGLQPHQLQAATWIQWRNMYPPNKKEEAKKARILAELQKKMLEVANGPK